MKCGSCRKANALSYTKILQGHHLFEILKHLHPQRMYNEKHSYFCDTCVAEATKQLETNLEKNSHLSDQNANSLSARNVSFTTTIDSSIDEYGLLVAPRICSSDIGSYQIIESTRNSQIDAEIKRKATSDPSKLKNKPCPKRFKKQRKSNEATASIPKNDNPEPVGQVISSQNSEAVSENDVLLNIQRDNADSTSSGERASSRASVESSRAVATVINAASSPSSVVSPRQVATATRPTSELSDASYLLLFPPEENASNDEQGVEAGNQIDSSQNSFIVSESDQPLSTMQQAIVAPSAPAAKNPRNRQQNVDLLRLGLRSYFEHNGQAIDVNNYSRLTAG